MGNNMIPYTFAVGEKYTYFLSSHHKYIENDKIEERSLLNATNNSLDPYDYHVETCVKDSFKTIERSQIHTFYPYNEEDEENEDLIETIYTNGKNEMVRTFNQKFVICYERDSVYAFGHCGHQ